jgi:molybdate transport system substrate-binding protein
MAMGPALADLADAWRRLTDGDVRFESEGGVDAAKRVQRREPWDVAVLASDALHELAATGAVLADTWTDLAHSSVAIAVRAGAPRPEVGSETALRDAVLAARSIGHSTGPSGVALQRLFERWGLLATVRERLVQALPGIPVGQLIADGRAELGFQQQSELLHQKGIEVLGLMPAGTEIVTTFSAAQCAPSTMHGPVRALLNFLSGPEADAVKRRYGFIVAGGDAGFIVAGGDADSSRSSEQA